MSGGTPVLSLSAPEAVLIKQNGNTKVMIRAEATNFSSKSNCDIFVSNDNDITFKVKPAFFSLTPKATRKKFKIILPFIEGQNIVNNGAGENVSINVTCDNGANEEINILFTPLIEDIIESRTYSQIIHKQE